eukprot:3797751-Prymnesium_polylepis.1
MPSCRRCHRPRRRPLAAAARCNRRAGEAEGAGRRATRRMRTSRRPSAPTPHETESARRDPRTLPPPPPRSASR